MKRFFGFVFFYLRQILKNNGAAKAIEKLQNPKFFRSFLSKLRRAKIYQSIWAEKLTDLPIKNIKEFRENFEEFNIHGMDLEIAKQVASGNLKPKSSISAGFSTGTSGSERGIFLTDEMERIQYIATILGKLFNASELLKIRKIGLCLRAGNDLYNSGLSKRIDFRFFPLVLEKTKIANEILQFAPEILIAPTQILIEIAKLKPSAGKFKHVFYGAEGMNDFEKKYIENEIGIVVRPIYQATEGFLGIGCKKGNLHLNEDIIAFECKHLTQSRFIPIITDINRKSQKVVRLELDDILELEKCDCGNKNMVIGRNIVRKSDVWKLDRMYFPDEIEKIVAVIIPPQEDYIIIGARHKIEIALENEAHFENVAAALSKFGIEIVKINYSAKLNFPKRRHIRWHE